MPKKVLIRRAGAEGAHADKGAVAANDRVPALSHACFDGDIDLGAADDRVADFGRRFAKQLETGHRNHAGGNAVLAKNLGGFDRN